jgi:hypothetical protein
MPSDCPAFFDDQLFTHVGQMSNPFFLMKQYDETVEHYLLHCKTYTQERKQLKQKVKGGMRSIGRLLGNHKNAEAVIEYVKETGRLRWMRGEENGREQGGNEGAKRRRREREGVEEEGRGEGRNRRAGDENG